MVDLLLLAAASARDFIPVSTDRTPRRVAGTNATHVLVIGAGVIGLTTAWTLLDHGYNVTVLADQFASRDGKRLTSQIAGALWEYPPAVCGHHADAVSLEHSKRWSMTSYHIFSHMAADPVLATKYGVRMRKATFFFPFKVTEDEAQRKKMREIQRSGVAGFRHDVRIVHEVGLTDEEKWQDAYEHLSPVVDTDRALIAIEKLVEAKGAKFVRERIEGDLLDLESDLRQRFGAHAIVNATGLGAKTTASDNMYPLRGAVLRVLNDGTRFEKLERALVVSATAEGKETSEFIFMMPRNDHILYIGGFSQPDETDLEFDESMPLVQRMIHRAQEFIPDIAPDHIDTSYPIAKGLRPARVGDVRVERELRAPKNPRGNDQFSRIVHSYGHAGSGWSFSFGCAMDVMSLVDEAVLQEPPTPMKEATSSSLAHAQIYKTLQTVA